MLFFDWTLDHRPFERVKAVHLSTAIISLTVNDSAIITIAIKYEVAWTFD